MGYLLDLLNETDRIQHLLKECQMYGETHGGMLDEDLDKQDLDNKDAELQSDGETEEYDEEIVNAKRDMHTEPTLCHEHSQEKFYYLSAKCEESEYLSLEWTENPSVILCLYAIVDKHDFTPMLAFVQQRISDQYAFPRFTHTDVMNECHKRIYSIFGITPGMNEELFQLCFKGSLPMQDSWIFFFDTSRLLQHQLTVGTHLGALFDEGTVWATYDELMKHKVFNIPVEASVPDFMAEHEFLCNITNSGKKVANPVLLYPITLDFQAPTQLVTDHSVLGEVAFFTDVYGDYSKERYVGFVDDCLDLGSPENWSEQLKLDASDKTGYKFISENKTVYGMKSSAFYRIL